MTVFAATDLLPRAQVRPVLLTFFGILLVAAGLVHCLVLLSGLQRFQIVLLMWTPGFSALVAMKLHGLSLSYLGWQWGKPRYIVAGYCLPLLYGGAAYAVLWGLHLGGFGNLEFISVLRETLGIPAGALSDGLVVALGFLAVASMSLLTNVAASLGEEIGWRGMLMPFLMRRYNFMVSTLVVSAAWFVWHLPIILFSSYNAGPDGLAVQLVAFGVLVFSLSVITGYLRLKSGSVWPAAILHAAHNSFIVLYAERMTIDYDVTPFFSGEFGVLVPAASFVIALYYLRRTAREGLWQSVR